ncbi:hypothetical protein BaRGS_00020829 [Batillaria attramentaria]|uniref:Fibronectin type-III domain-containing protein n=1 Tax=Batillaria attramentaria TaxID=370345 RepID=A0ABD0KL10_9CAEN
MRSLQLMKGRVYYLRAGVTNGAGLKTTSTSKPIMLDTSPPSPGEVKVGTDWTVGVEAGVSGSDAHSPGMIALKSLQSEASCVTQARSDVRCVSAKMGSDGHRVILPRLRVY